MATSSEETVGTTERSKSQQSDQPQVYVLIWSAFDGAGVMGVFSGENAIEAAKKMTADEVADYVKENEVEDGTFDSQAWKEDEVGDLINESDGHILYTISAHDVVS